MDPSLRSEHVAEMYRVLAGVHGVPDDVWCFPAHVFSVRRPPLDYVEVLAWDWRDKATGGPWTAFITNGMSDAPPPSCGDRLRASS